MELNKKEALPVILIIASLIIAIYNQSVGNNIILHWDFVGNITSEGPSEFFFILPIVMCLVYYVLLYNEEHPEQINRIKKIPNNIKSNNTWRKYWYILRTLTMLLLLYITVCSAKLLIINSILVCSLLLILIWLLFAALHILHKKTNN